MPDEEVLHAIKGINRAVPAGQVEPGECASLENLVPVGPPGARHWTAPRPGKLIETDTNFLSIGWQTRSQLGELADTQTDPDQALNRLVGLAADGLYTIDPSQGYVERKVWSFDVPDDTREATFAEIGDALFICVTSGCNDIDTLLELRDDEVAEARWPDLPLLRIDWTEKDGDAVLPGGVYVFRLAWRLDDGTIGPSTGPYRIDTGSTAKDGYEFTFRVGRYPTTLPLAWENRLSDLVVIAHVPALDENGDREVKAINEPGYRVSAIGIEEGDKTTWSDSREGVLSSRQYEGMGLGQHGRLAGTITSYNKRLLLGDAAYDLYDPDLAKIVEWEDGVQNSGGNDHWLLMQVEVETPNGTVERLSAPLPFDATAATEVKLRSGLIWYRDIRALRWEWYVSTDHTEGAAVADSTWKRVVVPAARPFEESTGANLATREVPTGTVDITKTQESTIDATDSPDWSDQLYATDYDTGAGASNTDSPHTAVLTISDVLAGTDPSAVTVWFELDVQIENDTNNDSTASADITVRVKDSGGVIIDSATESLTHQGVDRPLAGEIELDSYTATNAVTVEVETTASASVGTDTNDDSVAAAGSSAVEVTFTVSGSAATVPIEQPTGLDRDVNRITWSDPFKPYNIPPGQVIFAGDRSDSPVMALRPVGQEVSEGQYGEYPIVCFQKLAVRALRVNEGEGAFIQKVDVLETEAGLVSRRATASVDGQVIAALTSGIYVFTPQPAEGPLSEPLHDAEGSFLSTLRPGAALSIYIDSTSGRREIWVASGGRTYVYSMQHGAWSTLTRQRRAFARGDHLHGLTYKGNLVVEQGDSSTASGSVEVEILTQPFQLNGQVGRMERLKRLMIDRERAPDEIEWTLLTLDPDPSQLDQGMKDRARRPDGRVEENLLPNVEIETGTLTDQELGTIWLKKALGYAWALRITGTLEPTESIDAVGGHFQARKELRATELFPTVSDVTTPQTPADETVGRCPSDQRSVNIAPAWVEKDDLVWAPGNAAPRWTTCNDFIFEKAADNVAPAWVTKDDLLWPQSDSEEVLDPYEAPTVGDTRYVFTANGGFARFRHLGVGSGMPLDNYQPLLDDKADGELAADLDQEFVWLAATDGVYRYDLSGQNVTQIISGSDVVGLAADPLTDTLYVSYRSTAGIDSFAYDGTGQTAVVGSGTGYSLGIAPDGGNGGFIFGASETENEVARWGLDGSNKLVIFDGAAEGTTVVRHVALWLSGRYVYYQVGDSTKTRNVLRSDFRGTSRDGVFVAQATVAIRDIVSWDFLEEEEILLEVKEVEDGALKVTERDPDGSNSNNYSDFSQSFDTGAYIRSVAQIT